MILNILISLAFNHKISIDGGLVLQQWMRFRKYCSSYLKLLDKVEETKTIPDNLALEV